MSGCKFENSNIQYSHFVTENAKTSNYYKHAHNEYELLYYVSGDADYLIEDTIFTLSPGDLIFIKPKNYHMLVLRSSTIPYERINIAFNASVFDKKTLNDLFADSHKISLKSNSFFIPWAARMDYNIKNYNDTDKKLSVHTLITELILYLKNSLQAEPQESEKTTNPTLRKAIEYINTNLTEIKNVKDVAQKIFISESYLHFLFNKYLNVNPKQYITQKKMLKAEEYIQDGIPLKTIYLRIGFEDYSSFFRAFKKYFGRAPSSSLQNLTENE